MIATITPQRLSGIRPSIPSKSIAHRAILCAAFADKPTHIVCPFHSQDIDATLTCIQQLGARVEVTDAGWYIYPVQADSAPQTPLLNAHESGSTFRFLIPIVAATGRSTSIATAGRLAKRPLGPLQKALEQRGVHLQWSDDGCLQVTGKQLAHGTYQVAGNVSSQFISGLLLAAPLIAGDLTVEVCHPIESEPYIQLTIDALAHFGVRVTVDSSATVTRYSVAAGSRYVSPGTVEVEGDWSNAAFWLAAGALSPQGITVTHLNPHSHQGDRYIIDALAAFGAKVELHDQGYTVRAATLRSITLNVEDCPDLVPPIAVLAAYAHGKTRITGASRLRLKESDRLETVSAGINALGGHADIVDDELHIMGTGKLVGGTVDAANDHRIAMMSAIAGSAAESAVVIRGASCVDKSYPSFYEHFQELSGLVTVSND